MDDAAVQVSNGEARASVRTEVQWIKASLSRIETKQDAHGERIARIETTLAERKGFNLGRKSAFMIIAGVGGWIVRHLFGRSE